jgi:hypothetical protein
MSQKSSSPSSPARLPAWLTRLSGPLKIGLGFATLAIVLTIVGILRDPGTPVTAWSIIVGSLISGLTWGVVSWAVATAAVTVEKDVSAGQGDSE